MIEDTSLREHLLAAYPFLRQSPEDFKARFFRFAHHASLETGATVCREGTQCTHLPLVLEGSARVYKLGETGREITLYRLGPGESCILTASCILSDVPFPAFAVCETPLEAAVIPAAEVRHWAAQSPQWRQYVFGLVADRLGDVIGVIQEVAFQRVDRRLSSHLLQYARRHGAALIQATHQEIAADLGTSREVVSRVLKDLEAQGLIATARGSIRILDEPGLQVKARE